MSLLTHKFIIMKKTILLLVGVLFSALTIYSFTSTLGKETTSNKIQSCDIKCKGGSCKASGNSASCTCDWWGDPRCSATSIVLESDDIQKDFQRRLIGYLSGVCHSDLELKVLNSEKLIHSYINSNNVEAYKSEIEKREELANQIGESFKTSVHEWVMNN